MRTRKTTYLLTTLLLTFNSAWAACELGVPGEGGCEHHAAQPNGNMGNVTAEEWWGGLKSSVKQMGSDIVTVAKDPVKSFKDGNKENQGNSGNKENEGANAQNVKPAAAKTSGSVQGKPKQKTAASKPAMQATTSATAAK